MAFPLINYAAPPSREFSPFDKLVENLMGGYEQATKNKFLHPQLQEELRKAQLGNQYQGMINQFYPQDIQSQIANRQAMTQGQNITNQYLPQTLQSQIGLIGNQSLEAGNRAKAIGIENQYLPQLQQAKVQEQVAAAKKAQILAEAMGMGFPGQGQQTQTNPMQGQGNYSPIPQGAMGGSGQNQSNPYQSVPIYTNQNQSQPNFGQKVPRGTSEIGKTPNGMTPLQIALLSKGLGLDSPKLIDVNGKIVAFTPFGNIETGIQAPTLREKEATKADIKTMQEIDQVGLNAYNKQIPVEHLTSIVASPEFEQLRQFSNIPGGGKLEMYLNGKAGTKEQQEMVGKIAHDMGQIITTSSVDFKGAFRSGEQGLLNSMKPEKSDTLDVMKGKLEALNYFNQMMIERSKIQSESIRNGMSPLKSSQIADQIINPQKLQKEIYNKLHPKEINNELSKIPESVRKAEIERRRIQGL